MAAKRWRGPRRPMQRRRIQKIGIIRSDLWLCGAWVGGVWVSCGSARQMTFLRCRTGWHCALTFLRCRTSATCSDQANQVVYKIANLACTASSFLLSLIRSFRWACSSIQSFCGEQEVGGWGEETGAMERGRERRYVGYIVEG